MCLGQVGWDGGDEDGVGAESKGAGRPNQSAAETQSTHHSSD